MKNNDAYDPDSCGEDYAGQPPDDDSRSLCQGVVWNLTRGQMMTL